MGDRNDLHQHEDGIVAAGKLQKESCFTVSSEGFVVLKGSVMTKNDTNSLAGGYKKTKEILKADKIVSDTGDVLLFEKDYLFRSPSHAAACILGYAVNGRATWKDRNGKSLNDLEKVIV